MKLEFIKDVLKDFFINGFRHNGRWCHVCLFWSVVGVILYPVMLLVIKLREKKK